MSYIGTQPVPQSLQSRQQFTGDGSTTEFATIGGVELYEDVFLNGVRLSRVDNEYSFDGTTLTITPAPANGDTVSIILRNDHSELIALPITDSAGNNVLSESGSVVTLTADEAVIEGSSSGDLVRITQTGSGNALVVEDSANPDSTPFVIDASGNVGIGSTPSYPFQVGSSDLIIDSSGNLLVGTTDIDAGIGDTSGTDTQASYRPLQGYRQKNGTNFYNRTTTGDFYRFRYQGTQVGSISIGTTATAYNTSSDYRLKEDWVPMSDSIARVKALNPVNFAWKVDGSRVDGFLAHEAAEVVPEVVTGKKDAVDDEGNPEYQSVDYGRITPLLTAALKEAIAKIEMLETRIALLEAK